MDNILNSGADYLTGKQDIQAEKKEIRKQIKVFKSGISQQQMQDEANLVFEKIESLAEFKKSTTIFLYWSLEDELPTHRFIEKWSACKQIILPSVSGKDMILKKYSETKDLITGKLGISEPAINTDYEGNIDLVIVPGIAFDKSKNRLGRGKGFYDRYFNHNKLYKIGICFDFQLLNTIPTTSQDVKMDKIITASIII